MANGKSITCPQCQESYLFDLLKQTPQTFRNGTHHVKGECPKCGIFLLWIPQGGEPVMPFGKHKDRPLKEIARTDRDYLEWCLANLELKGNLREKIEAALV